MSAPAAHRKFFDLPSSAPDEKGEVEEVADRSSESEPSTLKSNGDVKTSTSEGVSPGESNLDEKEQLSKGEKLLRYIEENVIGNQKVFSGPYGKRKVVYCDYTASGKSLAFIEDYISKEVLPDYGNTHTTTTVTSLQTTLFRNEARDIVRNAVHASEHDAVLFVGSGCTAAVHKLLHALHLTKPPVVLVGPYEHHSNLLPWREAGAVVCRVRETSEGLVDLGHLENELQKYRESGQQLIGCFSAASNITGVLTDVNAVTVLLHRYEALAFWDYATAGAYVNIDMNPVVNNSADQPFVYKDAIFLSPHKFVGGVQTPGVLVAKKNLFKNPVPSDCGGGSVFFVRRTGHRYLQEVEMREEGGTPAIVESVRAGLVFQLKEAITAECIMEREHQLTRYALDAWSGTPSLVLLGPTSVPRLAVFSFVFRHPQTGLLLHHNYVASLLNDLFGLQARGGCACAGPYAEDLLGIQEDVAIKIEEMLAEDGRLDRTHLRRYREYSEREILRPGFVRLNLPYFVSDDVIRFVVEAVKMAAEHAWKLLPQYTFNPETGEWRHRNHQVFRDRKWLGFISYKTGAMTYRDPPCPEKGPLPTSYQECLGMAQKIFDKASSVRVHIADQTLLFQGPASELRWFLLPSEALSWLQGPVEGRCRGPAKVPFEPLQYPKPPETDCTTHQDSGNSTPPQINLTYVGCCLDKVSKNENKALKKQTSQKSKLDQKPPATRRRELNRIRDHRTMPKRCRSEERTLSTATASLVADGFFAALKNIGKETGVGDFSDKLKDALSQGFVDETDDQIIVSDPVPSQTDVIQTNGMDAQLASKLTIKTEKLDLNPKADKSGAKLEEIKQNGDISVSSLSCDKSSADDQIDPPAGVVCLDGACFKKREMSAAEDIKDVPGKQKWHAPNKKIFKPTVEALEEFNMVRDGDRLLVCLSGGKDSLSLLHTMRQYQFYAKQNGISFELGAVTVDPMTSSYDPSPLKGYLAQLGVPYFYEEQGILEAASALPYEVASICSFCSRMKRGRIYQAARREGYNVLAMGQHLDDLAESFLMSLFHNGLLRTMKACYSVQEGDLRLIRPFVYVRETHLREFAEQKKLPVIPENCPACFEAPKERHRMKQLLAAQEVLFPRLFHSLRSAMKPILAINKTGVNVRKLFEQMNGEEDDEQGDMDGF